MKNTEIYKFNKKDMDLIKRSTEQDDPIKALDHWAYSQGLYCGCYDVKIGKNYVKVSEYE